MPSLLMLGPDLNAVSGISTHLNQLIGSSVGQRFRWRHFQVGSEGRRESPAQKLVRMVVSPLQFAAVLLRDRPDIVHINSAMEPKAFWRDLAYLLVAWALRRQIVFQVHGGALPLEFTRGSALFASLLRAVFRMPDQVVLLAEIERVAWRQFMPGLRTVVIANAIDTGWVSSDPDSGLRADGPLRLVFVGRLIEAKGLFEVVDALQAVREQGVPVSLQIAGSGPDEARLRARVDQLALTALVEFVGPVFGEAKDRLWRQADVLVFPTWHREGMPYALLEAMAAGVVPITCPVGGIPDVITDRHDGLLVPPRDPKALAEAIRWVHQNRAQARAIADAARARVATGYTVERLADDFCDVYLGLCPVHR